MVNKIVKNNARYWWKRIKLLEAIKKDGVKSPLYVVCRGVFASGNSLSFAINQMEEKKFIIKYKEDNIVKTYLTPKGESLLKLLKELKKVWNSVN